MFKLNNFTPKLFLFIPIFIFKSALASSTIIDGSSTVFPIFEALAEEYLKVSKTSRITVGTSGTGGGFKKFCSKESHIATASRPIKKSEVDLCQKNKVEFIELPLAFDGLTVVVSRGNKFVDCLTTKELKLVWEPNSKITNWNQIRPEFPLRPLKLFGPGADSGTFDYFTEAIVHKEDASRKDFTASEDDNVLVKGVQASVDAMGYFGYAFFIANNKSLKALKIDSGTGCVEPTIANIQNGTYLPLSRPLFIYVAVSAAENPDTLAFLNWSLENSKPLIESVGYIPMSDNITALSKDRLNQKTPGTLFLKQTPDVKNLESFYKKK
jgi:phosphate transport system substrate-binding protein